MKTIKISFVYLLLILSCISLSAQVTEEESSALGALTGRTPISVTIGGDFILNGSFPSFNGERVDQFVTRTYNQARASLNLPNADAKLFIKALSQTTDYALRGIEIVRNDESRQFIDLLKFRLSGDFAQNPYLKNDDVIIFPSYNLEYDFIEITGAVNRSTKFQFIDGDKLSDAIFFARGINPAFENVSKARISRLTYDGNDEEIIEVGLDQDITLQRGDRINIIANQPMRKGFKVQVLGEVNNPGEIFITENSTTLKEVIEKAGGFTNEASLKDAQVIRNLNQEQVLRKYALEKGIKNDLSNLAVEMDEDYWRALEILRMYRTADLMDDDTLFFNANNQLRILEGNRLVDFTKVDSINSSAANFLVKNNDLIIIPEKSDAVYVFGQVGTAGYYKFEDGKGIKHYLKKAGGLTESAKDDDEIYLIKSTTREWINIDEEGYNVEPGDYIYVLKETRKSIWYYIGRIGTVAGIVGSIATLVLLFK